MIVNVTSNEREKKTDRKVADQRWNWSGCCLADDWQWVSFVHITRASTNLRRAAKSQTQFHNYKTPFRRASLQLGERGFDRGIAGRRASITPSQPRAWINVSVEKNKKLHWKRQGTKACDTQTPPPPSEWCSRGASITTDRR